MLFSGKRDIAKDLAKVGVMQDLDFSGYMLDRVQVDEYAFNWRPSSKCIWRTTT